MQLGTGALAILYSYQFPAIFFGAFFLGETVVIPAAFLAGESILSLHFIFWVALLGTVVADTLCFFAGPHLFRFAHRFRWVEARSEKVLGHLQTVYADQPLRTLLISKFVYGTLFLTVIYLSQKMTFIRFFLVNLGGTLLWLIAVVAVGYLAGRSIINLTPIFTDAKYVLLVVILLIIGARFGPTWVARHMPKK